MAEVDRVNCRRVRRTRSGPWDNCRCGGGRYVALWCMGWWDARSGVDSWLTCERRGLWQAVVLESPTTEYTSVVTARTQVVVARTSAVVACLLKSVVGDGSRELCDVLVAHLPG
ncbi:hypothetical protein CRG98_031049 [Punica granatum]|uniref:Uncharacterized protein n=1 Tax=Punica granatum TaxID=22663 RepID=A0A2I0IX44_PUNGR|nr:hypothetical protein CRG98_031049 [Punica granatum]